MAPRGRWDPKASPKSATFCSGVCAGILRQPWYTGTNPPFAPLSFCPISFGEAQPQKHPEEAFGQDGVGKTTREATGQRDEISHGHKAQAAAHRQLLPQPARKSWKDHYAAQASGASAPSVACHHPKALRWWLQSPHTSTSSCTGTGAWLGTWDVARVSLAQGWAIILLWSFSRRAGEQWVHKEREKELTVPWMGAGVKDEAVAMEA